ncbi:S1 RNA-binding domain-containing protein 1-like [Sinocyclocheilus grahami]|uniref:S1 RNA-binding domain-containing protein 1-like n=1 Tax=Sinocyclocheilus grahami TaxID=75366 RepID=UPI0007ACADAE|nr:PREDICTED: S1 RNA-binding domain-containing protein 1-like [Sinocyclocheilus grahami]
MLRRTRTAKVYTEPATDDESDDMTGQQKGDSEELEEWLPNSNEGKTKGRRQRGTDETGEKKKVTKRVAKPKEPKPKAARKPRAARVPKVKKEKTNTKILPKPELQQHVAVKEERLSINLSRNNAGDMPDECPSSSQHFPKVKKEEPDDSFTFNEPAQKKQKTTNSAQGRPIKLKLGNSCVEDLQMNWDPIQVLAEKSGVEQWVCANIVQLFLEENTIPFMVRYRKELINHMDADAVRDVQLTLEELRSVAKKSRSVSQTLKKEGVLTSELEIALKNCTTANEIDHVYAPYKKGSKLSKARRAKELGLEPVALALLQEPQKLDLQSSIQPNTKGLSSLDEVATGVQEILADMIAKDKETLIYVQSLCDRSSVTIHSSVSKTALKEQQPQQGNQKSKPKDIAKFSLYIDFTGDVQRIQHHQHDVSQSLLRAALDGVVQECVSFVGVDINICSETLMRHIAGLNTGRARSIMEWKEKNGPFLNREQLKLVKGLGPKSFQQCAGFIRIIPETVCSSVCSGGNEDLKVPLKQTAEKKKVKGSGSTSNQFNPLDQTCIHPESYSIALRFLSEIGGSLDQMGSAALRQSIESSVKSRGLDVLAKSLDTTPETLQLIVDGLTQPPGFDIRQDFEQADFKREIVSMNDLHDGMVVTGRVTNTALFGAFVDIGVGRSGLIPKRFITPDKLPVDQRQRSLALGPGERVEVRVINVDLQRNRISLDLIRVLR